MWVLLLYQERQKAEEEGKREKVKGKRIDIPLSSFLLPCSRDVWCLVD
jgi:hypothetical protein